MKLFALATLCSAAFLQAQDYSLGPDSQVQAGVPKGVVTRLKLEPGKFYPGTPHNYAIYVPAQYDPAKPTPFMVFMDGSGPLGNGQRVPIVFDNLIAKKELPPLIGIFVDPGVLPAEGGAQSRYERVFEYDSLSDRFSRFLLEELIPEVGKKYNLSKNPDDHAISGVSTGAVGAFMAAWNRPDQFHRVLSFIGTFVAMKGGDSMPALIRRTEQKPIRVFLQDGKNDHLVPGQPYGTFYAGSWPINNQVMFDALQFRGYDAKLVLADNEGHAMRNGASIMPEALRWLWRDYPKPITVGEPGEMGKPGWDSRGQVASMVASSSHWEAVTEGPVPTTEGARTVRSGPEGKVYAAQPARKRIVAFVPGGAVKVIAQGIDATDLAVTAKGGVYFTDTAQKTVGYIDPAGKTRVVYNGGEIAMPSGIALSPDQGMLIVTDAQGRFSWSFQIASDGALKNGEPFYRLEMPESGWMSGVLGVTEDSIGQVYFATPLGIQVCEANGRVAAILNAPEHGPVTSVAFGGKDMDWLYVTQGGKTFRRQTKVHGVAASAPASLPKPPL